jgi:hypothetical protein
MNKQWKMIVSDINEENIHWATKNVLENNLADRILSINTFLDQPFFWTFMFNRDIFYYNKISK